MDEAEEFSRFVRVAKRKYRDLLAQGYSPSAGRFNNSNLHKRWIGWLDCARYREEHENGKDTAGNPAGEA